MDTPATNESDESTDACKERRPGWRVDEVLEIACYLAEREAIASVRVATPHRPTFAALLRYRRRAEAAGLTLTVSATEVAFRPRPRTVFAAPAARRIATPAAWIARCRARAPRRARPAPREGVGGRRATPGAERLGAWTRSWRAGLAALAEGTR